MKKTKNIIVSVLILCLSICIFSGCSLLKSTPTPTKTVDTFLQAIKNKDSDTLATVYEEKHFDFNDAISNSDEQDTDEVLSTVEESLQAKILDFDYTLSNEQINGDNATVDIEVTTYKIGDAFTNFFNEYLSQAFVLAFSDGSEEEIEALAEKLLSDELSKLTEKSYTKKVTLSLTKKDNKWIIDKIADDNDFYDAITGGLITSINTLSNIWGEDSTSDSTEEKEYNMTVEDNDNFKFEIISAYDGLLGKNIKYKFTNKTDYDVQFSANSIILNDETTVDDVYMICEAAAKTNASDEFSIDNEVYNEFKDSPLKITVKYQIVEEEEFEHIDDGKFSFILE